MSFKNIVDVFTAIGTVGAVIVAMRAIYRANKISKQQILVAKFEELYEVIQILGSYYEVFKLLYFKVMELRDPANNKIRTRSEYFAIRDLYISKHDLDKITNYLSRLDVLSTCYTKDDLQRKALSYNQLMLAFVGFVYNAGDIQQAIHFNNGFPEYQEFYSSVDDLKKDIKYQIKKIVQ